MSYLHSRILEMGAGFSTAPFSNDAIWGSVAIWDEECSVSPSKPNENWYKVSPNLFQGFTDSDMERISSIIVSKKSCSSRDIWCFNHDIIRVVQIKWIPDLGGYEYVVSVQLDDGTIKRNKYFNNRMHRLAIHLEALDDY